MIIIFIILVIVYYHFTNKDNQDIKKLNQNDSNKKKALNYASFIGTLLVLISGIIFLTIVIIDEDIEVEIAFN